MYSLCPLCFSVLSVSKCARDKLNPKLPEWLSQSPAITEACSRRRAGLNSFTASL